MQKVKLFLLLTLAVSFFGVSCDKDDDKGGSSRTVKYEISGSYTGRLVISYTTASGGTTLEETTTLPWAKEITYASTVTGATLGIGGNGGAAGQTISIVVKKGGTQVSSTPATANSSGGVSAAAPTVIF